MDLFTKLTIILLSLQLSLAGALISRLYYKLGILEGRAQFQAELTYNGPNGSCFALNSKDCEDFSYETWGSKHASSTRSNTK